MFSAPRTGRLNPEKEFRKIDEEHFVDLLRLRGTLTDSAKFSGELTSLKKSVLS